MSAQDEFNALVNNNKIQSSRRDSLSDKESDIDKEEDPEHPAMPARTGGGGGGGGGGNTYIPNTVYDANTGPKGVIADAQAFERARKTSFRKTLLNAAGLSSSSSSSTPARAQPQIREPSPGSSDDDDNDDEFMRKWRASRMQELQGQNSGSGGGGGSLRRVSPRRRVYGVVEDVDAEGYLDAIEMVPAETVVVVCIYDPESPPSTQIEKTLSSLAPHHPTTRFVKLHHEIAEMDHVQPPALLAYRGAEVFATLVDVFGAVERKSVNGRSGCDGLGDLLREHRVL